MNLLLYVMIALQTWRLWLSSQRACIVFNNEGIPSTLLLRENFCRCHLVSAAAATGLIQTIYLTLNLGTPDVDLTLL